MADQTLIGYALALYLLGLGVAGLGAGVAFLLYGIKEFRS